MGLEYIPTVVDRRMSQPINSTAASRRQPFFMKWTDPKVAKVEVVKRKTSPSAVPQK